MQITLGFLSRTGLHLFADFWQLMNVAQQHNVSPGEFVGATTSTPDVTRADVPSVLMSNEM